MDQNLIWAKKGITDTKAYLVTTLKRTHIQKTHFVKLQGFQLASYQKEKFEQAHLVLPICAKNKQEQGPERKERKAQNLSCPVT